MGERAVLAIDEGTTNAKAILVNKAGAIIATGAAPVPIAYPEPGWVEQDANAIWDATCNAIAACIAAAPGVDVVALGISNQRESVLIWDRRTGEPLGPVITWQCRRTSRACAALRERGHEGEVIARTGLPIDPLFPPTKAAWLLARAPAGADLAVGTVDSWLIWKLSGGTIHATDRSNAARTQFFNLAEVCWDETLLGLFGIDGALLPDVFDSAHVFGRTKNAGPLPDGLPIAAAIGDSHAALFSHAAFTPGDGKVTFGTGSSVMTTLADFIAPPAGVTTTIAWSLEGRSTFAFEGNILTSASIFPWTANLLALESVEALLALAETVPDSNGVALVPAHVGLGAPHWNSDARGLITGLSFGAGPAHVARAAAESMALQVNDVFAIVAEAAGTVRRLSVDGGPSRNPFLMQMVADALAHPVTPCENAEASALGAAHLAGLAAGFWDSLDAVAALARHGDPIHPAMAPTDRSALLDGWRRAIAQATHAV